MSHFSIIASREGGPGYVKGPTDVGTGKTKDEKAPLSEIVQVLNKRFGTQFIEDLMIERMGENDRIVTRYMSD
jgi:type I restriction enzyme R subunit